jgi:hypothetical protein
MCIARIELYILSEFLRFMDVFIVVLPYNEVLEHIFVTRRIWSRPKSPVSIRNSVLPQMSQLRKNLNTVPSRPGVIIL